MRTSVLTLLTLLLTQAATAHAEPSTLFLPFSDANCKTIAELDGLETETGVPLPKATPEKLNKLHSLERWLWGFITAQNALD
jgi:hypothetical protein